jgi:hypothetical protein
VLILRVILSCYVLVWLTFVVPGHTRGKITIPGAQSVSISLEQDSCCSVKAPAGKSNHTPTQDERKRCAVCYAIACFMPAPLLVVYSTPLALIELSHDRAAAQVASMSFPSPFWPAAPPTPLA